MPMLPEAQALHLMDMLDARMEQMFRLINQDTGTGEFTTYVPSLSRQLFRGLSEREEQYDGAGRYLVAAALRLPGSLAGPLSALALISVAAWVWTRRPPAPVGGAALLGALLVAASPVQPWYAVTLLAFATLAVTPRWTAVVVAGYPYFFSVILLHPNRVGIGQLVYAAAAAIALMTRIDRVNGGAGPRRANASSATAA